MDVDPMYKKRYLDCLQDIRSGYSRKPPYLELQGLHLLIQEQENLLCPHCQTAPRNIHLCHTNRNALLGSIRHVPRTRNMLKKGMRMGPARYHYIKEDVPADCHIKTILTFSLYILKVTGF
jgi:hypothetical protein